MAKHALVGATIYLGNSSIDVSDHVESIEFSVGQAAVNVTAFGSGWEENTPSNLKRWSVRLNMLQDFDSSETYSVLQAALTTGAAFPIFCKATTAAVSATNPGFTGSVAYDGDFNILGAGVGEANKASVTLKGAGTLTFQTSATA